MAMAMARSAGRQCSLASDSTWETHSLRIRREEARERERERGKRAKLQRKGREGKKMFKQGRGEGGGLSLSLCFWGCRPSPSLGRGSNVIGVVMHEGGGFMGSKDTVQGVSRAYKSSSLLCV